jgi:CotH kinase protein
LRGWPELLLRLQGGGAEAFARLALPSNLGTPGVANSRLTRVAGPALWEVGHRPVLPQAGQEVVVTARVDDPQGVRNVTLNYRIDPENTLHAVAMKDDGHAGDRVAADGIFSAKLPPQPAGTLAAFHLTATDGIGATSTFPRTVLPGADPPRLFPSDATSHECLVRYGEPSMPGVLAHYRLWMTQANRDRWAARAPLNNAAVDVAFVYNDERVVYNAGALFSGSSWHTSQMSTGPDGTNRCDYVVQLPSDDRVLGETDFNLVLPGFADGSNGSDLSGMSEQIAALLIRKMKVHSLHRRYVHLFVNGSHRSKVQGLSGPFVCEDIQQPNGAVVDRWYPKAPRGPLFKVEDWFEFQDDAIPVFEIKDADLRRRSGPDGTRLPLAPYRYMWRPRSLRPGESGNDYRALFDLIDAVSPVADPLGPIDLKRVSELADIEEWFRAIACQRMLGNSDSYGWERGKNSYLYRPGRGRFVLIPWDVDSMLGLGGEDPNGSIYGAADPRVAAMMEQPDIRRMYRQIYQEMLEGPLRPGVLEKAYDDRVAAFRANAVSFDPSSVEIQKQFLVKRRLGLTKQVR